MLTPDIFAARSAVLQGVLEPFPSSYPKDYQRIDQKTEFVVRNLSLFDGCRVVDLGSNFGMFSLLLASHAECVWGIERSKEFVDISSAVQNYFTGEGFSLANVSFLNASSPEIAKVNYNAILATLVLYHLSDEEVDCLIEDAKSKCERIMLQARPGRAIMWNSGRLPDYTSRNTRFNGLYDVADNIRFLHALGFQKITVETNPVLLGEEVFPVIFAVK